ncbi:MAG: helix-turn-helix domain-containing protein [Eubacterium sp.]|nr:helix-turn-helix domain-containing protein [Eubacterium sp.]
MAKVEFKKDFYTAKEVASYLDCSYAKVLDLIKKNDLPASKLGGTYYVNIEDLLAWIEDKKVNKNDFDSNE